MTESTMIERVARALCRADGHPENAKMDGKPLWASYKPEARAAIATMRDGTRAMYEAAAGEQGGRTAEEWERAKAAAAAAYLRTIDAALAEEK